MLDAAAGGPETGVVAEAFTEKDLSLKFVKILGQKKMAKLPVVYTRIEDYPLPFEDRIGKANRTEKAIFISVHFAKKTTQNQISIYTMAPHNSQRLESPFLIPIEKVHNPWVTKSVLLAQSIQETMPPHLQTQHFHVPYSLHGLQGLNMPAVLLEIEMDQVPQSLLYDLSERIWIAVKTYVRNEKNHESNQ